MRIDDELTIPLAEVTLRASRLPRGPGRPARERDASRVEASFDVLPRCSDAQSASGCSHTAGLRTWAAAYQQTLATQARNPSAPLERLAARIFARCEMRDAGPQAQRATRNPDDGHSSERKTVDQQARARNESASAGQPRLSFCGGPAGYAQDMFSTPAGGRRRRLLSSSLIDKSSRRSRWCHDADGGLSGLEPPIAFHSLDRTRGRPRDDRYEPSTTSGPVAARRRRDDARAAKREGSTHSSTTAVPAERDEQRSARTPEAAIRGAGRCARLHAQSASASARPAVLKMMCARSSAPAPTARPGGRWESRGWRGGHEAV